MRNKRKESEGITLIALVVTIIVLLILAGISIQMLTGDNGILTRAGDVKVKSERAEIIENARIDVLTVITDNKGENPEEGQLIDVFKKYFKNDEIPSELPSDLDTLELTTLDNQHIIKASEIYNGTFKQLNSKTVAQLYSAVYDENDENYNANAMHIGDWVDYDAGNWAETKGVPTTIDFGGYTSGQSRNTNANGINNTYSNTTYQGWRIWDITSDNQVILVSAGCPEVFNSWDEADYFYHWEIARDWSFTWQGLYNANMKLTGENEANLVSDSTITARDWSIYKNNFAQSVRMIRTNDFNLWINKYISNSITNQEWGIVDSEYNYYVFQTNNTNKLMSLIDNGFDYFLGGVLEDQTDGFGIAGFRQEISSYGLTRTTWIVGDVGGVRPLITLKTGIRFDKTPEKIQSDGFTYNKWTISDE